MRILTALRIVVALSGFLMLAYVANAYHTSQRQAVLDTGVESKFVSQSGQVQRMGEPGPSMIETARIFVNDLLGREEKPKSDLARLRQRQAFSAKTIEQRRNDSAQAEVEFWTGLMTALGFSGP